MTVQAIKLHSAYAVVGRVTQSWATPEMAARQTEQIVAALATAGMLKPNSMCPISTAFVNESGNFERGVRETHASLDAVS